METQVLDVSIFPSANSLFSPDVTSKTASDLLIRLSELTQKAQVKPGALVDVVPQREALPAGQEEEPGLALSPDGPGASPEPPTLTHTHMLTHAQAHTHARTHTPHEDGSDTLASDLLRRLAGRQAVTCQALKVKQEEEEEPVDIVPTMRPFGASGPITEQLFPSRAKMEDEPHGGANMEEEPHGGANMEEEPQGGAKMEDGPHGGAKMEDVPHGRANIEDELHGGAKMEDELHGGAKMAVVWRDPSIHLASTLLYQLSERVSGRYILTREKAPPTKSRSSPLHSESSTVQDTRLASEETSTSYFYRCHVCGFEARGRGLFQGHMTGHSQWERRSFSLRCCLCELSTNQEAEMRTHTHTHGDTPTCAPQSSPSVVSTATPGDHRCRVCQRSFPGQQELLAHVQGHRQGNRWRCQLCVHVTRTATKLAEHVRVHTGERPFTCDLCPYRAKRPDSLRLHRRARHPPAPPPAPRCSLLPLVTLLSLGPRALAPTPPQPPPQPAASSQLALLGYLGLRPR